MKLLVVEPDCSCLVLELYKYPGRRIVKTLQLTLLSILHESAPIVANTRAFSGIRRYILEFLRVYIIALSAVLWCLLSCVACMLGLERKASRNHATKPSWRPPQTLKASPSSPNTYPRVEAFNIRINKALGYVVVQSVCNHMGTVRG